MPWRRRRASRAGRAEVRLPAAGDLRTISRRTVSPSAGGTRLNDEVGVREDTVVTPAQPRSLDLRANSIASPSLALPMTRHPPPGRTVDAPAYTGRGFGASPTPFLVYVGLVCV